MGSRHDDDHSDAGGGLAPSANDCLADRGRCREAVLIVFHNRRRRVSRCVSRCLVCPSPLLWGDTTQWLRQNVRHKPGQIDSRALSTDSLFVEELNCVWPNCWLCFLRCSRCRMCAPQQAGTSPRRGVASLHTSTFGALSSAHGTVRLPTRSCDITICDQRAAAARSSANPSKIATVSECKQRAAAARSSANPSKIATVIEPGAGQVRGGAGAIYAGSRNHAQVLRNFASSGACDGQEREIVENVEACNGFEHGFAKCFAGSRIGSRG